MGMNNNETEYLRDNLHNYFPENAVFQVKFKKSYAEIVSLDLEDRIYTLCSIWTDHSSALCASKNLVSWPFLNSNL